MDALMTGQSPDDVGQSLNELRQRLAELDDPRTSDERAQSLTDEIDVILGRIRRLKDSIRDERAKRPIN